MEMKNVIDKMKQLIQTVNEKWEMTDPIRKSGALTIGLMIGLILTGKAFMFLLITIIGIQRIFYFMDIFKTESYEMPTPVETKDEDIKDK